MTLEDRIVALEQTVAFLVTKIASGPVASGGSNRKWDSTQRDYLVALFSEHHDDLDTIVAKHNEKFCPKGYVARTKSAIACQLWNLVEPKELGEETYELAKKYMTKKE